jgi:hypothetical protein
MMTQAGKLDDYAILSPNLDGPNWLQDKDFGRFVSEALDEHRKNREETVKRARLFAAIHI